MNIIYIYTLLTPERIILTITIYNHTFTYTDFRYHLFLRGDANVSIQLHSLFKMSRITSILPFKFLYYISMSFIKHVMLVSMNVIE